MWAATTTTTTEKVLCALVLLSSSFHGTKRDVPLYLDITYRYSITSKMRKENYDIPFVSHIPEEKKEWNNKKNHPRNCNKIYQWIFVVSVNHGHKNKKIFCTHKMLASDELLIYEVMLILLVYTLTGESRIVGKT